MHEQDENHEGAIPAGFRDAFLHLQASNAERLRRNSNH